MALAPDCSKAIRGSLILGSSAVVLPATLRMMCEITNYVPIAQRRTQSAQAGVASSSATPASHSIQALSSTMKIQTMIITTQLHSILTALVLPKPLEAWAAVDLLTITVTGHTCD